VSCTACCSRIAPAQGSRAARRAHRRFSRHRRHRHCRRCREQEQEAREAAAAHQEDLLSAGSTADYSAVLKGETRMTQATANLATTIIGARLAGWGVGGWVGDVTVGGPREGSRLACV
jgi:multidrug resistance efflux pump